MDNIKWFHRNSVTLIVLVIWLKIITNIYRNLDLQKAKKTENNLAAIRFVSPFLLYDIVQNNGSAC